MSESASVSGWISGLQAGELAAVQNLWDRYRDQLVGLAQERLRHAPVGLADGDDIAQSVFISLCRGAAAGRFNDVRNRDELWWLLLAITKQKAVDLIRRENAHKRGGGNVRCETAIDAAGQHGGSFLLDDIVIDQPTPEMAVILEEQTQLLLNSLRDDILRRVAVSRIEGYSVAEIAALLKVSVRAIERKLQLIRRAWSKELQRGA